MLPKLTLATALLALTFSAVSCTGNARMASRNTLSEDEKHRLYSAALAATEAPLESELFKDVCRRIGIFDAEGKPNNNYMSFVSTHVEWAMKAETGQFKAEINTRDKARDYISKYVPR